MRMSGVTKAIVIDREDASGENTLSYIISEGLECNSIKKLSISVLA